MRLFTPPVAAPTSAERIRTILTAADSMTVVTDEGRVDVSRLQGAGGAERIHLHPTDEWEADPERSGDAPCPAGAEAVRATLEFTDVAPTPVRDRVRARVVLAGWLLPESTHQGPSGSRCMEFGHAMLDQGGKRTSVGLRELMAAEADPLATCEAGMLTHMADDHGDLVDVLLRLVKPRRLLGVRRALPVAVDRYGITLRLEHARSHEDVRLPFPAPLWEPDEAGARIHALLDAARRRTPRSKFAD